MTERNPQMSKKISKLDLNIYAVMVTRLEKGKKQVNIAQVKEILKWEAVIWGRISKADRQKISDLRRRQFHRYVKSMKKRKPSKTVGDRNSKRRKF